MFRHMCRINEVQFTIITCLKLDVFLDTIKCNISDFRETRVKLRRLFVPYPLTICWICIMLYFSPAAL